MRSEVWSTSESIESSVPRAILGKSVEEVSSGARTASREADMAIARKAGKRKGVVANRDI